MKFEDQEKVIYQVIFLKLRRLSLTIRTPHASLLISQPVRSVNTKAHGHK